MIRLGDSPLKSAATILGSLKATKPIWMYEGSLRSGVVMVN